MERSQLIREGKITCKLCVFLDTIMNSKFPQGSPLRGEGIKIGALLDVDSMGLETGRDVLRLFSNSFEYNLEFCIDQKDAKGLLGEVFRGRTLKDTQRDGSEQESGVQTIRDWIDTCRNHEACRENYASTYPTRLIDVGSNIEGIARLIDTDEISRSREKYVFLSFQWGRSDFFMNTQENLHHLQSGVPWECFAKVHQEAMSICRQLGYRYIWIDALCIIQGVQGDFHVEGTRMGGYIESADLVFAAANESALSPLIQHRIPGNSLSLPAHLEVPDANNSLDQHHFTLQLREPKQDAARAVQTGVLHQAWRVIEVLLARRIVIFDANQLFWSCCDTLSSEGSSFPLPPIFETIPAFKNRLRHTRGPLDYKRNEIFRCWYSMVEMNSRGKLRREGDRLVSIAFVMQSLFDILKYDCIDIEYWAGIWNQDRLRGLLWISQTPSTSTWRADEVKDPSWSWASNGAPVSYSLSPGLTNIEPSSNLLETQGFQVPCLLHISALSRGVSDDCPVPDKWDYFFDAVPTNTEEVEKKNGKGSKKKKLQDDKNAMEEFRGITFLLVAPWTFRLSSSPSDSRWAGLIAKDQNDGTWVRRGVFLGPLCNEELNGWEKKDFKLV
ncbi:hypothetical protein K505DRAFT_77618 [Melanomma pulvis-pyrius CBS 109.77]|uniref:Heterokaryon incompatibility domain-containing protein n=1 Tax=Melanomma pulvis-pyrius CBS 109.77 TaxID=1314802 RepID=A0A6A6X2M0_9PLEO|nr:hypothetical protein K505DRAFT_77618 [Melanomma pulvis-pyrius CBS 109.77]